MYARSTTVNATGDAIDAGVAYVRDEVMSLITSIEGCIGLSVLVDRQANRCIATSSWESQEAMRMSDAQLRSVREEAAARLGGSPQVQEWEIALMHRKHDAPDGACARVTWIRPVEGGLDEMMDSFRYLVLPDLEQHPGFCSASMLIDRGQNLVCGTGCFESRADLENTRPFAAERRAAMSARTGAEFVDVMECELAMHHLRVPELV
jgi:quinol monooxygenase YgiN